jgi:TIGR01777 family protein
MKTIAINGTSGFLGSQICKYFANKYHIVKIKREDYLIPASQLSEKLQGVDIVINLAGERISPFMSRRKRKRVYDSRISTTKNLVDALNLLSDKPRLFVSFSAIGIYDFEHHHKEGSTFLNTDFLAVLCKDWEYSASFVKGTKVLTVRTGIVLSSKGGLLQTVLKMLKIPFGLYFGKGAQSLSFIHIDDFLRAMEFSIEHDLDGIVNFVGSKPCSYYEFMKAVCSERGILKMISLPSIFVKLALGEQSTMLLKGQYVIPGVLLDEGFQFQYAEISDAINHLMTSNK